MDFNDNQTTTSVTVDIRGGYTSSEITVLGKLSYRIDA